MKVCAVTCTSTFNLICIEMVEGGGADKHSFSKKKSNKCESKFHGTLRNDSKVI